jgi:hypothetical protein
MKTKNIIFLVLFAFIAAASWTFISSPEKFDEILDFPKEQQTQISKSETWEKYDNSEVGFSFKYPSSLTFLKENEYNKDSKMSFIKIEIQDIGKVENPMDFNFDDAMINIESLSSGKFGLEYNFPFAPSKTVKSVGFLFAQDFLVIARFELCSVTLERKLLFYFNNKQMVLSLFAPIDLLLETMPNYFTIDKNNCGDVHIWNQEKQTDFYNSLKAGNASPIIQKWFDQFDEISETIVFAHR